MKADRRLKLRSISRKVALLRAAVELQYVTALHEIMATFQAEFTRAVHKYSVLSLYDPRLGAIEVHYLTHFRGLVGHAFDRAAPGLLKASRETNTLMGITSQERGLSDVLARAREESIRLVEKAGRAYAADVRAVIGDPANADLTRDALRKLLVERGGMSLRHADLIARDQVLKTTSALTQAYQRNAGITEYDWSGVMDRRERESHVALEGRRFRWDQTTPIGYHPGEDYECRCVPIAVIPGTE